MGMKNKRLEQRKGAARIGNNQRIIDKREIDFVVEKHINSEFKIRFCHLLRTA